MAARLKVFITSDGLTDYVVATSSKPKALATWGSHQDLFKTGIAHETDDPALVKAAKPPKPAGPSKAALKKVADLEARLADADAAHARELAELDARREALVRKHVAARTKLEAALSAAKQALG
jgi:hypothetical protein